MRADTICTHLLVVLPIIRMSVACHPYAIMATFQSQQWNKYANASTGVRIDNANIARRNSANRPSITTGQSANNAIATTADAIHHIIAHGHPTGSKSIRLKTSLFVITTFLLLASFILRRFICWASEHSQRTPINRSRRPTSNSFVPCYWQCKILITRFFHTVRKIRITIAWPEGPHWWSKSGGVSSSWRPPSLCGNSVDARRRASWNVKTTAHHVAHQNLRACETGCTPHLRNNAHPVFFAKKRTHGPPPGERGGSTCRTCSFLAVSCRHYTIFRSYSTTFTPPMGSDPPPFATPIAYRPQVTARPRPQAAKPTCRRPGP